MAERRPFHAASDDALAAALHELATSIEFPTVPRGLTGEDLATRTRRRIVEAGIEPSGRPGLGSVLPRGHRSVRRSLVFALIALLVVAAVAAAVGFGLPRLRIIFGGPSAVPSTTSTTTATGPPGGTLGLGTALTLVEAERLTGLDLRLPADPTIGPPDGVFLGPGGRVSLVWQTRAGLPETASAGVGLLVDAFHGTVGEGYYEKAVRSAAQLTPVRVSGEPGYWIEGPPHFFYFVDPSGNVIDDQHRVVGDTLVWTADGVTFRLESALGMDAAIRLAESLE